MSVYETKQTPCNEALGVGIRFSDDQICVL